MYGFDYQRPADRAAIRPGTDARYLAGGQSLVQAMRLRLAQAGQLIDLGGVADLRAITVDAKGVTIGAMATHAAVAASSEVRRAIPVIAELAGGIGDPMVRNMGTIGGSIANADPAACYPAALLALGATVHTDGRTIAAESFFTGLYETALKPGELITAVSFPKPQRAAYLKFKQPASRFALVGVCVAQTDGGVRVAVTGAKAAVFRVKALEDALAASFTPEAVKNVKVPPEDLVGDLHATAEYRAEMIRVMTQRAVAMALAR
jgi:carbon-monoxide dehydrogenase medium subunit